VAEAKGKGKTPEDRLDAVEARTNALSDAMIVQGYLQGRIERNLAELTNDVRDLTGDVRDLAEAAQALADNQSHTQAAIHALTANQSNTQAALQNLIEQIDRFLRGQQKNGQGPS
jgi:chromosome segregation ATPase